jgi:hypothetical protein
MSKKFLSFIIFSLLAINIHTIVHFYRLKKQNTTVSKNDELHSYKTNFQTNIQNSNHSLEGVTAKDSLNNVFLLNNIFKDNQKQVVICRFSESHCESCVNFSIQLFRRWVDSIGKDNILFLGTYRNNKIFNRTKTVYGIHNLNVYNISKLNIPVEELGYPYYFVLNSDLTILNVFVPDKSTLVITDNYLEMIYKRYFK